MTDRDLADGCLPITLAGESLLLHPQRALIWPAQRTVFAADLHLGKSDVFRRAGIAIPEGATGVDLQRLDRLIAAYGLSRIVVLGDFLHAAAGTGHEPHYVTAFSRWRGIHRHTEFVVVAGNHDRRAAGQELVDVVDWQSEGWRAGPFICRHHPQSSPDGFVLSGHVHPAIRLRGSHRERARVPVCWLREGCAVLPSFGSFTGGSDIVAEPQDELFVFAADRVWRLPR